MMKIIEQLTSGSAKVKLSELNMPGRTTKSLSHMLGKIKDEAGVVRGGDRSTAGAAPKGKGSAKKATGELLHTSLCVSTSRTSLSQRGLALPPALLLFYL